MPRTRRRKGSVKGKTRKQIALAVWAQRRKDQQEAHRQRMLMRAQEIAERAARLSLRAQSGEARSPDEPGDPNG